MEKEVWQKYKDKGVQVIGINTGEPERIARAFKAHHKLTFSYLLDRDLSVFAQFSTEGALPHVALIDTDLTLKHSEAGGTVEELIAKLDEVVKSKASAAAAKSKDDNAPS